MAADLPKLTVVIPTRHRGHTLGDTLRSCIQQPEQEGYEILVSDNLSGDGTEELVAGFRDPRIRYIQTPAVLTMEGNWEFALQHVQDGYVIILGGDDALVPGAVAAVRGILAESGALALRPPLISYHWHNYPLTEQAQIARGVPVAGHRWWWEDSQEQLRLSAESLYQHQYFFEVLPTIYHGVVHTSVLEEARRRNGEVFSSKLPDMFNAVLVAAAMPRYARTTTPVSLNAMSCSSNSVGVWLGGHEKDKEMRHFLAVVDHPYEPELLQDSASPDNSFVLPILIADQYLKLQKRGWNVPAIPLERVFEATVRGARRWRERGQYDSAVRVATAMAAQYGWEDKLKQLLAKHPFDEKGASERPRTLYEAGKDRYRFLDLRSHGATGACSAGKAIVDLREVHRRQRESLKSVPESSFRRRTEMMRWSLADWTLWALVRQEAPELTGQVRVMTQANAILLRELLTPPSRVCRAHFGGQPEPGDAAVLVPWGSKWAAGPVHPGTEVLTLHREQNPCVPPAEGLQLISTRPLCCDANEALALALAGWLDTLPARGWKRRSIDVLLAPVWHLLQVRLAKEPSSSPVPSGWVIARWSLNPQLS